MIKRSVKYYKNPERYQRYSDLFDILRKIPYQASSFKKQPNSTRYIIHISNFFPYFIGYIICVTLYSWLSNYEKNIQFVHAQLKFISYKCSRLMKYVKYTFLYCSIRFLVLFVKFSERRLNFIKNNVCYK